MTPFQKVTAAVSDARSVARDEARTSPFVWSRGTWFSSVKNGEGQCSPFISAEAPLWDGTKTSLDAAIQTVRESDADALYIEGGFDGGDRMSDKEDGNYEPWVSSWEVLVWTRKDGMVTDPGSLHD